MDNNLRKVKRFLNNLSLLHGLIRNKGLTIKFSHLIYWNIIDLLYSNLRDELKNNVRIISLLRKNIDKISQKIEDKEVWEISDEILKEVPQRSLHIYLKDRRLVNILKNFDITPEQLEQIITFTEIVGRVKEVKEKEYRINVTEFDKMVEVPAGIFLYRFEKQKENIEYPFMIDIYPVTNSQFERFIKDGGYTKEVYWSETGRKWRQENNITLPRFWDDDNWNQSDCPVVGISYFEAEAYCAWRSEKEGDEFRLPTEKEWEKAARGENGREYPWGNEFDKEKCNTAESGIGRTTSVTRYPNGISPCGCYDMAGNVWEWTDSWYDENKSAKVLRGGSWNNVQDLARCAFRFWYYPVDRYFIIGFRCVSPMK